MRRGGTRTEHRCRAGHPCYVVGFRPQPEPTAIAALPAPLPPGPARAAAFETLRTVVNAVGEMPPAVAERLLVVERIFTGPAEDARVRRQRAPRRGSAA